MKGWVEHAEEKNKRDGGEQACEGGKQEAVKTIVDHSSTIDSPLAASFSNRSSR